MDQQTGDFIPIKEDIIIPPARYPAVITKYDSWLDKEKNNDPYIRIYFVITEGQFRGQEVRKKYHKVISPKSALAGFCRDMGIQVVNQSGGFNPAALVTPPNRPCIITIINKEYGGSMRTIVTDVAPWVNAAPGTSLASAPPPVWTPPQQVPAQQPQAPAPAYPTMPPVVQPAWTPPPTQAPAPAWTPPAQQPAPAQVPPATSNPRLNF